MTAADVPDGDGRVPIAPAPSPDMLVVADLQLAGVDLTAPPPGAGDSRTDLAVTFGWNGDRDPLVEEEPDTATAHGEAMLDPAGIAARVASAIRAAAGGRAQVRLGPDVRLLDDLGFDSLRISVLALELEDRYGAPIRLEEWLAGVDDPIGLTVGSLDAFVAAADGGRRG